MMFARADLSRYNLSSVRSIVVASAPLSAHVEATVKSSIGNRDLQIAQGARLVPVLRFHCQVSQTDYILDYETILALAREPKRVGYQREIEDDSIDEVF